MKPVSHCEEVINYKKQYCAEISFLLKDCTFIINLRVTEEPTRQWCQTHPVTAQSQTVKHMYMSVQIDTERGNQTTSA